nr:hypothetical protein [Tanacetum cinerariifolium]
NVYNNIRRAVDLATSEDHHQHLKWSGDTLESSESKKLKSSHSTEQSVALQETTSISTGAIIAAGDPISAVPFVFAVPSVSVVPSVSAAFSIPAETPIAAGVSTTAGVFESAGEASIPIIDLFDSLPKATSLPSDLETVEHVVPLRKSSRKKSMARRRTLPRPSQSELKRATGIGLGLWSDLRMLITAREDRDASIIWDDQDQWEIRSWRFYALPAIH